MVEVTVRADIDTGAVVEDVVRRANAAGGVSADVTVGEEIVAGGA